jgi:hypothetical protein
LWQSGVGSFLSGGAQGGRPLVPNSGGGGAALTHHGTSQAQREINRSVLVEDEIDAASARHPKVQGDACALAVDREQPVQRITGQHCAADGLGLAPRTGADADLSYKGLVTLGSK